MMRPTILLLLILVCTNCAKRKVDFEYVARQFRHHADQIIKVEYTGHRIDTFPQGNVWNNRGFAHIEKDPGDDVFGFSFRGVRDDVPYAYIYDKGKGLVISMEDSSYQIRPGNIGFVGSPGGQMVPPTIFTLDSVYRSAELVEDKDKFILKYEFDDDSEENVKDRSRIVELSKTNFFPLRITESSTVLGNKSTSEIEFTEVKFNDDVQASIADYKIQLAEFKLILEEKRQPNKLLNRKLPLLRFPDLRNQSNIVTIDSNKPVLLDFWEVWCGPCIQSFPKVEQLQKKYGYKLQVVGILTEDKEKALDLVKKKGITFLNAVGNEQLMKDFSVNGIPTYFLIDKRGVIKKEYFGFSETIEADIIKMLSEK